MMTIAIPLKKQSDYTELQFALRSIDRFVPGSEVLIIGEDLPYWITNITWIKMKDVDGRKQLSVKKKILAALEYAKEICFSNDDIFWLNSSPVEYYTNGPLKHYSYSGSKELQENLKQMGKPTKSFEVHMPIIFRSDFKEIIKKFTADTLIRSAYANYLEIEGVQTSDCKFVKDVKPGVVNNALKNNNFISTGVYSIKSVLPYLREMFPGKSCFEV